MVSSGFFNSKNGDRAYDSEAMSAIFDGVIRDGVYETVGDKFRVIPGEGMQVMVGTGRAWFNHTWTLNDSAMPLDLDTAETGLNRIDLVVLEVNFTEETRENSIKVLTGTPAETPERPTLTKTDWVIQYPLASIYVRAEANVLSQADITNYVGTSECPFVIGVLQIMTIDQIVAQWQSEWSNLLGEEQTEFAEWVAHLHGVLDSEVAGHLQEEIDAIQPISASEVDAIWDSVYGGE